MACLNGNRIVVLIDMDCFFCQVETKLQPEHVGKPLAVVQYSQWQFGGIIAVNYEAREYGVTRHMRADEAKEKCPDLVLATVPCLRGKADTSRYRVAGREVVEVIRKHCNVIERASVDEAYIDITDIVDKRMSTNSVSTKDLISQLSNTFVVGYSETGKNDEEMRSNGTKTWVSNIFEELEDLQAQRLAIAGTVVEELRTDVFEKTGYRCSAGIAQNKILAKLACGLHKPNRQTILPASAISTLYSTLPIKKVTTLGGKFGDVVIESLNCNVMNDLLQYSLQYLQKRFDEKTGLWLYNIARGVDHKPVTMRLVSKSIGACKKFPGKQAIVSIDVLKHWAGELAAEVCERLEQDHEENERRATLLTISYHYYQNRTTVMQSRSCTLNSYKQDKVATHCVDIVTKSTQCPVAYLGISAGKFVPAKGSGNFMNFFKSNKLKTHKETSILHEGNDAEYTYPSTSTKEAESGLKLNKNNGTTTGGSKANNFENMEGPLKMDIKGIESSKSHVQLNKKVPVLKVDDSPTSRKVKNLIRSLNKRSKAKTLHKNEINSNINESLNQDKFKGSFFMNIFNKENRTGLDACTDDVEILEFGNKSIPMEINNDTNHDVVIENLLMDDRKSCDTSKCNIVTCTRNNESDNKLNFHDVEHNYKKASTSYANEEENLSNTRIHENDKTIAVQTSFVSLQEIFPDLNNIDPSILSLLPSNLQEEAKLYMKGRNKHNIKVTENRASALKQKNNKSKPNDLKKKNGNGIYSFLIKGSSRNSTDLPVKQCTQCSQMILVTKYNEHCDFHMAESLQRKLNKPLLPNASMKRKDTILDAPAVKRRPNTDVLKADKNCKSITTFLS